MCKVRIGFIGTGGIAGLHARQLLALPEVTIKAVADTSGKNRGDFIEKFGLDSAGQFRIIKRCWSMRTLMQSLFVPRIRCIFSRPMMCSPEGCMC